MTKELNDLLKSLSNETAPVSVFCADDPSCEKLNGGNGYRELRNAVCNVDVAEITLQNTIGKQIGWWLVSVSEGIIDSST